MENKVGILAIEVYFPKSFVDQEELEKANGVSAGKYTIGLGQKAMAFTGDQEDINSISLTVVQSLLEKYSIPPQSIGRLEVGTESLIDKSKSTKTVLMSLFADSGNTDIEGATVVNACYGGTSALLNALNWADSSSWDGRYAIVVAADIAVYADGPARPSGGCGAVAMLVGRDAPLPINLATRTSHASHVWDFFKPKMDSEYPEVNGALSQTCYLRALDSCYTNFVRKQSTSSGGAPFGLHSIDHFLFHSPYNKLVQKSLGRVLFNDALIGTADAGEIAQWMKSPVEDTYDDKGLESKLKTLSAPLYQAKVACGCELSREIGNTYTASVYMNLANLVAINGSNLNGSTVVLFSYGSGALASMFEIKPTTQNRNSKFSLDKIRAALNIPARLTSRQKQSPENLAAALRARENSHSSVPYAPTFDTTGLFPGTFYLQQITASYERIYARTPLDTPPAARDDGDDDDYAPISLDEEDEVSSSFNGIQIAPPLTESQPSQTPRTFRQMTRNKTMIWASGRPNVRVVVTGVAAALPGREKSVYDPSINNVQRILAGENFISPIPLEVRNAMLAKNVVELIKGKDGSQTRRPVSTHEQHIGLCASIGEFSLAQYGVPESIAGTMDKAVQVAVSAGLEALRDAGIVSGEGEGTSGWVLPTSMQDSTGIVYATSFPALDAAIGEVSKYFETQTVAKQHIPDIITGLRARLEAASGTLSEETEKALLSLQLEAHRAVESVAGTDLESKPYEFDRKFLFRVLVLGNAQLAQIVRARGPNMQTNAACAGKQLLEWPH